MGGVRRWLHDTVGGLPATYWYLWSGLLVNRVGAFAMLFLSLYLTEVRGASKALAGVVVGAYGIGGAAGVLLGGVLADNWGRRATLLWSHLTAAALMVLMAFAGHLAAIAVLAALIGVVHSMPGPAFVAAIVDVVPPEKRSRAFNLQFWAFNLGMAGASFLAGLLAQASYLALFLVDAGATLATALIIAARVPETLVRRSRTPDTRPPSGLRAALTDRTFLAFVGLTFVLAVLTAQTSTIMPLAMRADGLSSAAYGTVVAFGGALIVVGQLFVPRLIDRHRKHVVLAVSTGLLAVGFGALAFADALPAYLAAALIWTVGSMLAAPPNAEINAELSPTALRGRYQAVFYLTFPAAAFLAPALGGVSLQHLGDRHWIVSAGVGLAAVIGHLVAGPRRERRVAALRAAERTAPDAVTGERTLTGAA
ncbi:Predicted arabinose efflux permease, MFS family [Micromonospora pattaloongensis]|uniref:Predicted arabinose efflux permease, MFS family n=1 Tax=Micromonospora pattaloongensis TaxID=405436 RepID=A0A1H3GUG6_9ACTN|nr:MFS transporter [Micromonospora pattaloongensis]SDY06972.1 Predicted arabinose efflux permease, MFS family [Micromonospora pattaloongensis]